MARIPGPVDRLDDATLIRLERDTSLPNDEYRAVLQELAKRSTNSSIGAVVVKGPQMTTRIPLCSSCGTDGLRKFSMIHASGISTSLGSTAGVGIGLGGGIGVGAASTQTRTQTALGTMTAPPTLASPRGETIAVVVIGLVLTVILQMAFTSGVVGLIGMAGSFAAGIYWYRKRKPFHKNNYRMAKERWDRSYMCERCGYIVVL